MTALIQTQIRNATGHITLDRPKALNSLSLAMVRDLTHVLLDWRDNAAVQTVILRGSTEKAFCAGGDIRFFHQAGGSTPQGGSAALDDFFTEEYALNHLIHFYPKPWIAVMDGIVMGGGMGLAQSGPQNRLRIVTERTKMAMPEVNIGLFPDVGGSYFLSRTPGQLGTYLGVSGEMIGAADALYAGLADVFLPGGALAGLEALLDQFSGGDVRAAIRAYAAPFASLCDPAGSKLAQQQASIDTHFRFASVTQIADSLAGDDSAFAQATLATMQKRSPLMMAVTLRQLRQGAAQDLAGCLRMERTMVRHAFTQGEVLEGIRAVVIDKDNQPHWQPAGLEDVTQEMVDGYFAPVWPDHAHPLRHLIDQ
ncbi:enoyl-CoA hydratase/isomerase family protein [Actimicrobium sp. CCC2.4]|uniref:enoyl-CoA hydratase/isomerase family protein n=1 Tax=Actimicrobium sp. CCC2.4 TaxID=3048606 RepID=UPI002AC916E0|nr:enoyl-CoA hydratase/isomerase family protein [Actimicrobium sp. CCC2.4]MEB0135474.1 enoyl-CoA hydratase/isomerase family protein [Actimicrobium sp. CCC2.4]WPX32354.1 enoyl-CoA hydratase/isomerase family protein [Actimicrobium sp. CCC2.4]